MLQCSPWHRAFVGRMVSWLALPFPLFCSLCWAAIASLCLWTSAARPRVWGPVGTLHQCGVHVSSGLNVRCWGDVRLAQGISRCFLDAGSVAVGPAFPLSLFGSLWELLLPIFARLPPGVQEPCTWVTLTWGTHQLRAERAPLG